MRITKVTTKTGDKGKTALADGSRVNKNSLRVHCLGSIDELNTFIGFAAAILPEKPEIDLKSIQNDLLNIGAEISIPNSDKKFINQDRIIYLEKEIELINNELPPLKEFILPGGSELISRLHIARTSCRNAERSLISMYGNDNLNQLHAKYMNRLSDYLFLLARLVKHNEGAKEEHWDLEK